VATATRTMTGAATQSGTFMDEGSFVLLG
jgi:hypothetical protein